MAKGGEKRKDKFAVRLQIYSAPVPEAEGNLQSGKRAFGASENERGKRGREADGMSLKVESFPLWGMRLPAAFPCKG